MEEETKNQIEQINKRLDLVQENLDILNDHKETPLRNNLDSDSKKVIQNTVEERLIDILFDNMYYYNTWFDGVTGFETNGDSYTAAGQLILSTAGTGVDAAYVSKVNPVVVESLDFTKQSRFRVSIQPRATTNQNIKAVVGDYNTEAYGFQIEDNTLQGYTNDGSSSTTRTLLTVSANTNYRMEARFFPGERVDFIVNGVTYGSIAATLPNDIVAAEILWSISITEQEAVVKVLELGSTEYIQSTT